MKRLLKGIATALALVLLGSVGLVPSSLAGGGGAKSEKKEAASEKKLTPKQQAVAAYNQGIAQRDRAWKVEKRLASTDDAAERTKLEAKMTKTFEGAAEAFKRAIRHQPKMFEAHSDLGYCLRRVGKYEEALKHYNTALEIEPTYANAIEYRGEAYLGLHRVDEAKEAYMTLFKGHSDQAPDLLTAFQHYVAQQQEAGENVEGLAAWVAERAEIAGQSKTMSQLRDTDW